MSDERFCLCGHVAHWHGARRTDTGQLVQGEGQCEYVRCDCTQFLPRLPGTPNAWRPSGAAWESWEPAVTVEELQAHLAKITYKPGWTLQLHIPLWGAPVLKITYLTQDSYRPREAKIGHLAPLSPSAFRSIDAFEHFVWKELERMERHECAEWFKVDGVMKYDPHKVAR